MTDTPSNVSMELQFSNVYQPPHQITSIQEQPPSNPLKKPIRVVFGLWIGIICVIIIIVVLLLVLLMIFLIILAVITNYGSYFWDPVVTTNFCNNIPETFPLKLSNFYYSNTTDLPYLLLDSNWGPSTSVSIAKRNNFTPKIGVFEYRDNLSNTSTMTTASYIGSAIRYHIEGVDRNSLSLYLPNIYVILDVLRISMHNLYYAQYYDTNLVVNDCTRIELLMEVHANTSFINLQPRKQLTRLLINQEELFQIETLLYIPEATLEDYTTEALDYLNGTILLSNLFVTDLLQLGNLYKGSITVQNSTIQNMQVVVENQSIPILVQNTMLNNQVDTISGGDITLEHIYLSSNSSIIITSQTDINWNVSKNDLNTSCSFNFQSNRGIFLIPPQTEFFSISEQNATFIKGEIGILGMKSNCFITLSTRGGSIRLVYI